MHEQSLVRSLLKQVEELRCEHGVHRVSEVRVEMGPLSGVEPLLLSSAFELLNVGTTAEGAALVIDELPLMAKCKLCNHEFEICDFVFRCMLCDGNVKVVSGDEFHLTSVSFSNDSPKKEPTFHSENKERESTERTEKCSF